LLAVVAASAQGPQAERKFHVSKADVQKALREIQPSSGGKLPVLDGFADGGGHSLANYKRGYYEYDIQVRAISPTETTVHVNAKITAWYAGASTADSGYRVLKSSGRLESDLLDSVDEKLNPNSAAKPNAPPSKGAPASPLPDSPSASANTTVFYTPRMTTAPSEAKPASSKITDPATRKQAQALAQKVDNLEEILHNQSRPVDLAVVKRANTPVMAQPLDGAQLMFRADAEDEFRILDLAEGWVHIEISSLSRGWIRRDLVDIPGAATISVSAMRSDQEDKDDLVRRTKEQIGAFPGKWEPLDGRQVKIIWVQPLESDQFGSEARWRLVKSIFRKVDAGPPNRNIEVAGVVVIFDSADGGMAAATVSNLQQWRAGHLSDQAFWKSCWRDPADSFKAQN
ncbi:MAG TPA: hypothetical protein VE779_10520, partial [Candidatus Angelobacter sp.]|nr:hypothetical protein [Candidatus Angelobacter sp.]